MWSWFLASLAVVGMLMMWEVGNGRRWPWIGLSLLGVPWLVYATVTEQYGFLLTTALSIGINLRNFLRHNKEKTREQTAYRPRPVGCQQVRHA